MTDPQFDPDLIHAKALYARLRNDLDLTKAAGDQDRAKRMSTAISVLEEMWPQVRTGATIERRDASSERQ